MSGLIHERSPEQVAVDALVLARVKRGMALLEEKYGPEWASKVDLDILDLGSSSSCVLGQVYGDWSEGVEALGLNTDGGDLDDSHFGFDSQGDETYAELGRVWVRELRALGVPG